MKAKAEVHETFSGTSNVKNAPRRKVKQYNDILSALGFYSRRQQFHTETWNIDSKSIVHDNISNDKYLPHNINAAYDQMVSNINYFELTGEVLDKDQMIDFKGDSNPSFRQENLKERAKRRAVILYHNLLESG